MRRVAGSQQDVVSLTKDLIGKLNDAIAPFGDTRAHAQHFVVARRLFVAAMHVGDDDVAVVFGFHLFVFKAEGAHQFHTANLKPDQVVGVINHPHLVGLGITHPYCSVVIFDRSHVDDLVRLLPDGLALLQKRSHALLEVGRAADPSILQYRTFEIVVDTSGGGRC